MFKKLTNYFNAASNTLQVVSAQIERHSEQVLANTRAAHEAEFGVQQHIITSVESDSAKFQAKLAERRAARDAKLRAALGHRPLN